MTGLAFAFVANIVYSVIAALTNPLRPWKNETDGSQHAFWVTIGVAAFMAAATGLLFFCYILDRRKYNRSHVFLKPKQQ